MRYCTRCVQPDTRPGIQFNSDGVCGACQWEDEKKTIDWAERTRQALDIAGWAKDQRRPYDCAIGVSGGKDSTRQALWARDTLGLHCLLVNAAPVGISQTGAHNVNNLKEQGFDMIQIHPNPVLFREMQRMSFDKFASNGRIAELYLYASTNIIAQKFSIPLVIQGENSALTLGTTGLMSNGDDALDVANLDTLSKGIQPFIDEGVAEKDLYLYAFDPQVMRDQGIRGMYMQYYDKDWSPRFNYKFSKEHGLKQRPRHACYKPDAIGTYVRYFQMDGDGVHVNQMLKHIKFGFGQCTDHACYDIREGLITRAQGAWLVKQYDGKCADEHIADYCRSIGISMTHFSEVAEKWRGPMWRNGALDDPIWEQVTPVPYYEPQPRPFGNVDIKSYGPEDG